jgi:hypothetical protein
MIGAMLLVQFDGPELGGPEYDPSSYSYRTCPRMSTCHAGLVLMSRIYVQIDISTIH